MEVKFVQELIMIFTNSLKDISIWSIIDILIVAFIFYRGYILIKETRAEQLLKGVILLLILIPISYVLRLQMLNFILTKTLTIGVLSIIIIFQPEIRRALEHIGSTAFDDFHVIQDDQKLEEVIDQLIIAVEDMAETKTGALIAIEQGTGLAEIISTGTQLDAVITSALIENIFFKNTPLHDGATIIRNDRIVSAGCVLPLTNNNTINKKLGTRHRAAIGLSEISDALVIVVSEETGAISLAVKGRLTRNYDGKKLKNILLKVMRNRRDKRGKTYGEKVKICLKKLKERIS
nr:diadenylate cyclase CdaA [Clostridium perfringens]